jgi:hypothetical protein
MTGSIEAELGRCQCGGFDCRRQDTGEVIFTRRRQDGSIGVRQMSRRPMGGRVAMASGILKTGFEKCPIFLEKATSSTVGEDGTRRVG